MTDVRPIDGNRLLRYLTTEKANTNPLDYNTKATYAECMKKVEIMPTLDYEPVRHGEWIYGITCYHEWRKCSECLVSQEICGCFTYCPNCGAKMDGGQK